MKSPPSRSRRPHPIPSFHPPSGERGSESMASGGRVDLDGGAVPPLTICMIGTCGFIGSHLCEKLMAETPHVVLAVDVYSDKIRHLVDPPPPHLAGRISFHRLNIKNDPRLEGLVKMADLVLPLPPSPRGSSSGAAAPAPTGQQPGDPRKSDQKTDPKPTGTSPEPIQEPRVEEARDCGGFAFLCALAGHKEAITGISMPMGSDKLYSGSADGSVRVWDGKSGKIRLSFGTPGVEDMSD
ncbi:hypothetical protein ZWY2020_058874 [Hordeum vulgare]|nr:hypothetical protein ZWY2020_058874 [Hordeum vulgare]